MMLTSRASFAMSVIEFYDFAKKYTNINAFAVTVQSAHETGNWTSPLWKEAYNGLGIKAHPNWIKAGRPYVAKSSREARGNSYYLKVSNFRKYNSTNQFLDYFVKKINSEYPLCAKNYDNIWGYYAGLYQGKYGKWATDHKYFEILVKKSIRTAPVIFDELWEDRLLSDYNTALYRGLLQPWQKRIVETQLQSVGIL